MPTLHSSNTAPGQLSIKKAVDAVCDRFENAWTSGQSPRIESFLEALAPADRPELFRELLLLEIALDHRNKDPITCEEYLGRFLEFRSVIDETFANLVTMAAPSTAAHPLDLDAEAIQRVRARLQHDGTIRSVGAQPSEVAALSRIASESVTHAELWRILFRGGELIASHAGSQGEQSANAIEVVTQHLLSAFPPRRRSILRRLLLGESFSDVAQAEKATERTVAVTYEAALDLLSGPLSFVKS